MALAGVHALKSTMITHTTVSIQKLRGRKAGTGAGLRRGIMKRAVAMMKVAGTGLRVRVKLKESMAALSTTVIIVIIRIRMPVRHR